MLRATFCVAVALLAAFALRRFVIGPWMAAPSALAAARVLLRRGSRASPSALVLVAFPAAWGCLWALHVLGAVVQRSMRRAWGRIALDLMLASGGGGASADSVASVDELSRLPSMLACKGRSGLRSGALAALRVPSPALRALAAGLLLGALIELLRPFVWDARGAVAVLQRFGAAWFLVTRGDAGRSIVPKNASANKWLLPTATLPWGMSHLFWDRASKQRRGRRRTRE